jgi:GNAT superfamily N-acetyltransferase
MSVLLNAIDTLALYDQTMRYAVSEPDAERQEDEPVVRLINHSEQRIAVVYSALSASNADAAIEREQGIAYGLGYHLEWKHYRHDQPADLGERLLAHGFVAEDAEAFMVLDLAQVPVALASEAVQDVRKLTDPAELADTLPVFAYLWGNNEHWLANMLINIVQKHPEQLSIYVAYVEEQPASVAWLRMNEGKPFAGLYGGSTREQFRKRGLYSALVLARATEAIQRGYRYLTIDALPTSRPIVEKFGFVELSVTTPYVLEC